MPIQQLTVKGRRRPDTITYNLPAFGSGCLPEETVPPLYVDVVPGDPITVTYISGLVAINIRGTCSPSPEFPYSDANGPNGVGQAGSLAGLYVDNTNMPISPIATINIGNSFSGVVPATAARLYFGCLDNDPTDNAGAWLIEVSTGPVIAGGQFFPLGCIPQSLQVNGRDNVTDENIVGTIGSITTAVTTGQIFPRLFARTIIVNGV